MSLLEAIIQYLATFNIVVGDGEDCFRDFMPEKPDNVAVFHEYSSDPLSPFTSNVHRSVQIKVRSVDAEQARAKAVQICEAFRDTTEDRQIYFADSLWGQVYIRQVPFKLSQDDSDRVIYCFNLGITTNILE